MNVTSGASAHGRETIEDSTIVQPELRSDGYCLVDAHGAVVAPSGAVASKSMLHYLQLFKQRPDTHVVMLWHGVATDALATRRGEIPITLEHLNANLFHIPVISTRRSPDDSWEVVRRWLAEQLSIPANTPDVLWGQPANAVVMTGYACLTVAETLGELGRRVRAIERSAESVLLGAEAIPPQWLALMHPRP
jgi:ribulose-5-phosphate 4-epimerase/fuculose-1-phosphate aldolase